MKKRHVSSIPYFRPLTEEQAEAYEACESNTVTILSGPAGSTKTYTAVAYAVNEYIKTGRRIILSRPAIEACGESLGALPGTAEEKLSPYLHPLTDTIKEYADGTEVEKTIIPLAHMRGRTFKNAIIVLDEAQNANFNQLKMLLTRIGKGSQIIMCGDWSQSDIRKTPFRQMAELLSNVPGIRHMHLTKTNARHPIIPLILTAIEPMEA